MNVTSARNACPSASSGELGSSVRSIDLSLIEEVRREKELAERVLAQKSALFRAEQARTKTPSIEYAQLWNRAVHCFRLSVIIELSSRRIPPFSQIRGHHHRFPHILRGPLHAMSRSVPTPVNLNR